MLEWMQDQQIPDLTIKVHDLGPFIVDIDCEGNNFFDKLDLDIATKKEKALEKLGIDSEFEYTKLY